MEAIVSFSISLDGEEAPMTEEEIKKSEQSIRNFVYDNLDGFFSVFCSLNYYFSQ